jgi:uncharacterized protein involved in exopolysaccharide biosynthesis
VYKPVKNPAPHYLPVIMVAVLAGCVTDDINLRIESLEKQVTELENTVEDIEAAQKAEKKARTQTIPAPCLTREALRGRIKTLLNERSNLLIRYTEKHPDIVELDRQIRLAQDQIRMLDAAETPCSGTSSTQQ